jgi:hypothetical protein
VESGSGVSSPLGFNMMAMTFAHLRRRAVEQRAAATPLCAYFC